MIGGVADTTCWGRFRVDTGLSRRDAPRPAPPAPAPGSVYPTLQQLVDEELIEAVGEGRRTEFQLTDPGRTYATDHAEELDKLWAAASAEASADAGLHESIVKLMGVVHQFRFAATDEQRAAAIAKLDETRRALYGILAE